MPATASITTRAASDATGCANLADGGDAVRGRSRSHHHLSGSSEYSSISDHTSLISSQIPVGAIVIALPCTTVSSPTPYGRKATRLPASS
ncbi:hypothetical protein DL764_003538 [Monosporascus ibericus]|uniref:Uncharacterized protein n=1 Tax=Monosporascus ibericus TaxID=155417 RepID=A0A4Q4TJH1_9PEZI|nr:hypothetical protein DL764_003538 [Monosporascus ibericus]